MRWVAHSRRRVPSSGPCLYWGALAAGRRRSFRARSGRRGACRGTRQHTLCPARMGSLCTCVGRGGGEPPGLQPVPVGPACHAHSAGAFCPIGARLGTDCTFALNKRRRGPGRQSATLGVRACWGEPCAASNHAGTRARKSSTGAEAGANDRVAFAGRAMPSPQPPGHPLQVPAAASTQAHPSSPCE